MLKFTHPQRFLCVRPTPAKVLVRASSSGVVYTTRCRLHSVVDLMTLYRFFHFGIPSLVTSSTSTPSLLHRVLQPRLYYIEYFNTHCDAHIRTHTHTPHLRPHPHPSARTHTFYDLHLPYTHTCVHANVNSMHSTPPADTGSIHRWCYRKRRFSLQERKPL